MASNKPTKIKFPLWAYLNQPLFHPTFKVMWHPGTFRRAYQHRFLERCFVKQSPRNSSSPYC